MAEIDTTRLLREHEVRTPRLGGDPYCAAGCGRPEHCEIRPLAEDVAQLRARLAEVEAERDNLRENLRITNTVANGEFDRLRARLASVREYVDHPGNWSAQDGRRRYLIALIDGKVDRG